MTRAAAFVRSDLNFPATSDPEKLAHYLYRKLNLNHRLTLAYQKLLMLYFYAENNYKQPSDPTLLGKINLIVSLQNNDPLYRNIDNTLFSLRTKNSYHTELKCLARENLLSREIAAPIPRSNLWRWKNEPADKYETFELNLRGSQDYDLIH